MSLIAKFVRVSVLITIILFQVNLIFAQTSLKAIDLNHGEFRVGFTHYKTSDSTRTYRRVYDYNNQIIARPIPISIWYPSGQNMDIAKPIKVLDYLEILKEEEEWEYLPNEQILNWFYYANTTANQQHLKERTTAYQNVEIAPGKFPVIVYAPSHQASSIENFTVSEYLASHGYIVIASPSRGTESRWFSANNEKNIETQARDIEFLIKEVSKNSSANLNRIATMGFSFGGLASVLAQGRNKNIKAVVSLDGTERYQYELIKKSPFFDLEKLDVPYIHMAQKDIPEVVLKEDNINPNLNDKFILYDSLVNSKAYRLKFRNLTHSYFSSLGILFEQRDIRQDKSDSEIMESYKLLSKYVLNFLNAFMKGDANGLNFIESDPINKKSTNPLISLSTKQPKLRVFSFQDFNELALRQDYLKLNNLLSSVLVNNPSLELPEGNLNTLGNQLTYNSKTTEQGIKVFLLATSLYPNSANLFDSLAEAYLFIGNKEMAIESFKKSLELNANNGNAISRLKQLEE